MPRSSNNRANSQKRCQTAKVLHGSLQVLLMAGAFCVLAILSAPNAQAQATNDTIHACYKQVTGDLRRVNSPSDCKVNEIAISWNKVGPQGPTGPQGPKGDKGDKGDPGPAGPPAVSEAIFGQDETTTTLTQVEQNLKSITVPQGKYVIIAKVSLENTFFSATGGGDRGAFCKLKVDGSEVDDGAVILGGTTFGGLSAAARLLTMSLLVTHEFTATGTIDLACTSSSNIDVKANRSRLVALKVNNLTDGE